MKKIEKLEKKNQDNKNKVEPLQRYNIQIKGDFFNKKIVEFSLLDNFEVKHWDWLGEFINTAYNEDDPARVYPPNTVMFDFEFLDMPEWVIPMMKILAIFNVTDEESESLFRDSTTYWSQLFCNYFWEKKASNNYILHVFIYGDIYKDGDTMESLRVNLKGYFINKNYYSTIQHNLSKTNG